MTARTYPKMVLIQPKVVGNELILSAPGMPEFTLNLDEVKQKIDTKNIELFYSSMPGVDVGDEAADWLSEYIVGKPNVLRLMYYPHLYPTKNRRDRDLKRHKALKKDDVGAYQDETSYMLINQASIDELNTHIDFVVKPLQFRPSIVVTGPGAYEEDNWKWVKIGDTIFRGVKPCQR